MTESSHPHALFEGLVYDEAGKPIWLDGAIFDIDARKLADKIWNLRVFDDDDGVTTSASSGTSPV